MSGWRRDWLEEQIDLELALEEEMACDDEIVTGCDCEVCAGGPIMVCQVLECGPETGDTTEG